MGSRFLAPRSRRQTTSNPNDKHRRTFPYVCINLV